MSDIKVFVKHQGKKYEVELDTASTGETFKYQLFSLTGVEPDRQKILVKGGQLKNDTDMSKIGAKQGQTIMMMGTPLANGEALELARPKEKMKFMEDMTEAEIARTEGATPAGLQNLGNTCYMNSTLQALRSVPELQDQLLKYTGGSVAGPSRGPDLSQFGLPNASSNLDLTSALRDLYKQMSATQQGFPPIFFHHALQQVYPQFAERAKTGNAWAQQDAEEAWTQILSQLRSKLKIKSETSSGSADSMVTSQDVSFIDKYMSGRFSSSLELTDPAASTASAEEPKLDEDAFLKLDCHIQVTTNHLRDGILAGLSEKIEKHSESLGRNAEYTKTSRISRLPKYLTVHFVRFFWRADIRKKTKILRKVTFPMELDTVEFCTDQLRKQLVPVRDKVRDYKKDMEDMSRARKRQKIAHKQEEDRAADAAKAKGPADEKKLAQDKAAEGKLHEKAEAEVFKTDAEYDAERAASLLASKRELFSLIDKDLAADEGANKSGLYELRGVVTHQGASADSGHYTAYVKKQGAVGPDSKRKEEDGKWWWFNDEKVSEVEAEKVEALSGGGEAHSALILLYRAFELPTAEEVKE